MGRAALGAAEGSAGCYPTKTRFFHQVTVFAGGAKINSWFIPDILDVPEFPESKSKSQADNVDSFTRN